MKIPWPKRFATATAERYEGIFRAARWSRRAEAPGAIAGTPSPA